MKPRQIDWLAAGFIFIGALVVYLLTVSPTVAFWDVGEFIACSVNLGVPHPPGTPLYVLVGRLFALLPISAEAAFRINFISVLAGALSAAVVVLLTSRVVRSFKKFDLVRKEPWVATLVGVVGALFTIFAFSAWSNSLEAEVYTPSALIGLLTVYLALIWRERTEKNPDRIAAGFEKKGILGSLVDNRWLLLAFYIIFLSAGIHLTPVMMLFALIPFVAMVNRRILPTFILGILGLSFMLFEPGWPQLAVVLLFVVYFFVEAYRGERERRKRIPAWIFLGSYLVFVVLLIPKSSSFIWQAFRIIGLLTLIITFFYAAVKYKIDMKFFLLGALLIAIAFSVQFYLMVRAHHHPTINMVNPSEWDRFLSVLRREQYGRATVQNQLWPRKTVMNIEKMPPEPTGVVPVRKGLFSLIAQAAVGLYWQVALWVKYFFWQWGLQDIAGKPFTIVKALRILLAAVPTVLGVFGLYSLHKRDRKLFWLLLTTFLISSVGLVLYLNMRFGHTGPLPRNLTGLPQEVRERDYFFTFSYVFYALFTGFGLLEVIAAIRERIKNPKRIRLAGGLAGGIAVALVVPIALINLPMLNRHGDWIPMEYGYNLLASCDEPSVILTNGDNDTFPLWFVQEVPSTEYENNEKPYKHNVVNANLSLLNTPWYIEHIKRKGAPISFVYESTDEKIILAKTTDYAGGTGGIVWQGKVAHPTVKKKTFTFSLDGKTVKADRRGKLKAGDGQVVGRIDHETGVVTLERAPAQDAGGMNYIIASYGSGEIENLPVGIPVSRGQVIYLADIIIRDMLATNSGKVYTEDEKIDIPGTTTRIPLDYLVGEMFTENVLADYSEGVMPVYFSTTVSPSRVNQYAPYLIQEGLVYRFRKAGEVDMMRSRPAIDPEKSIEIYNSFKMESILDPKVRRDAQSRGLFVNYGITMQEIAEELAARGEPRRAYQFVKKISEFDVRDEVRFVFLVNLDAFAIQAGEYGEADSFFAEVVADFGDAMGADVYLRRGILFYNAGQFQRAEEEFKRSYARALNRTNPDFQTLARMVVFHLEIGDTARAREMVDGWDRMFPGQDITYRLYLDYIKDPRAALRVLNTIIRNRPQDLELLILRDSIIETYNLQ